MSSGQSILLLKELQMIGSDTLLFPDTGPDFIRSLRTAVLYSKRVHVLTFLDPRAAEKMTDAIGRATEGYPVWIRRIAEYFKFVQQNQKDLLALKDADILVPLDSYTNGEEKQLRGKAADSIRPELERLIAEGKDSVFDSRTTAFFMRAFEACAPSYCDLLNFTLAMRFQEAARPDAISLFNKEIVYSICFIPYLLMLAVVAEKRGAGLMSWSHEVQDALWTLREQFAEGNFGYLSKIQLRRSAESALGHVIVEKHIPMAEDLPFEEILKIRDSRADELEAFRAALAELATRVDLTQWRTERELQIHDLIASRVDPALRDLRASIKASRLDVLGRIGHSWGALAGATIPAVVSCALGAPLPVSAVMAALGPVVVAGIDTVVQRNKLLNASQWSLLLKLKNSSKKVLH